MSKDYPEAVALNAYESLAESYAALIDTKPHNAYYERPATLSLLPEVEGKRVLDVGCGPGVYAELLAEKGARVVAFDVSESMVRLAREAKRKGSRAAGRFLPSPGFPRGRIVRHCLECAGS